ncbi:MAG: type II secretion system minor pseudopilin GspK [Desulfobulbaceae bacterium]|nr:type II secretion system minor pseudopilin GspK [Desulfobulbaceae bacterium]
MRNKESGMALVLTLLAVSFLVAVTVQLNMSVNWQLQAAANQRDSIRLEGMINSGLSLVRAALLADQLENEFDSSYDGWANLDPEDLVNLIPGGSIEILVDDLSGRLQVNGLVMTEEEKTKWRQSQQKRGKQQDQAAKDPEKTQRDLWLRFLTSGKFAIDDEEHAATLVDGLSDWLDEDDDERERGAESSYYSSQDPSYVSRNGPLLYPEELLLVKGMTPVILYGDEEHSGIIEYLTVAGRDGKLNINTAPNLVLQALARDITEEMVQELIDFRKDEQNQEVLERPDWYRQVGGFPGDIELDKDLVTTSSSYFQVTATATFDNLTRRGSGILLRDKNQEQTLVYWKVE